MKITDFESFVSNTNPRYPSYYGTHLYALSHSKKRNKPYIKLLAAVTPSGYYDYSRGIWMQIDDEIFDRDGVERVSLIEILLLCPQLIDLEIVGLE